MDLVLGTDKASLVASVKLVEVVEQRSVCENQVFVSLHAWHDDCTFTLSFMSIELNHETTIPHTHANKNTREWDFSLL